MKNLFAFFAFLLFVVVVQPQALAQDFELSGGWAHLTSDFGVDGFDIGAAVWFSPKVSVSVNYDSAWDTSRIGTFELTSVGAISVKNHLQNFLVGPKFFFARKKIKKYTISPFAEVQFGASHLNTKIQQVDLPEQSTSDSGFVWMIGGGVDYMLSSHWAARANIDLLRTHFADTGQSRLRFVLGVAYTFGQR
jgi:hypothetical protein